MKIKLSPGAKMPTRAHDLDAGLDLYAKETQTVPANGSAIFDTGVAIDLGEVRGRYIAMGIKVVFAGLLVSKSGLNVRHEITSTGLIDAGYTGNIHVKLYNHGDTDYVVSAGDKISQLVLLPVFVPNELQIVDELGEYERGTDGFGSTGR